MRGTSSPIKEQDDDACDVSNWSSRSALCCRRASNSGGTAAASLLKKQI